MFKTFLFFPHIWLTRLTLRFWVGDAFLLEFWRHYSICWFSRVGTFEQSSKILIYRLFLSGSVKKSFSWRPGSWAFTVTWQGRAFPLALLSVQHNFQSGVSCPPMLAGKISYVTSVFLFLLFYFQLFLFLVASNFSWVAFLIWSSTVWLVGFPDGSFLTFYLKMWFIDFTHRERKRGEQQAREREQETRRRAGSPTRDPIPGDLSQRQPLSLRRHSGAPSFRPFYDFFILTVNI